MRQLQPPRRVFALVDCNSFYASCETVFRPDLQDRPVAVLSNNDGMIVAANKLAKSRGMVLGIPAFQAEPLFRKHDAAVFSSNYALYGDMSARVMRTLAGFAPEMEVYSIDEAFLQLPAPAAGGGLSLYCREMRDQVHRWTGIPVSVGAGPTKTLAKLANKLSKKDPRFDGILDLGEYPDREGFLAMTPVGDVWGIGPRYARMLRGHGVDNALQFVRLPRDWVRRKMTVTGLHTWLELQGTPCAGLAGPDADEPKKEIISSRSFGRPVASLPDLREAVAAYVGRAAERLRAQGSVCRTVLVWIQTSQFDDSTPRYSGVGSGNLAAATAYTPELIRLAHRVLASIYRPGHDYKKAGVLLSGLEQADRRQLSLLRLPPEDRPRDDPLMAVMDRVNARWGARTLDLAAAGLRPSWRMRRGRMSPRYTTCWSELPVAKA